MMNNIHRSLEIYEKGGVQGVFDAVMSGVLFCDLWKQCEPCEEHTPHEKNICLVCWTKN